MDNLVIKMVDADGGADDLGIGAKTNGRTDDSGIGTKIVDANRQAAVSDKVRASLFALYKVFFFIFFLNWRPSPPFCFPHLFFYYL